MTKSARRLAEAISTVEDHNPKKDLFLVEHEGYHYVVNDTGRGWMVEEYQSETAAQRAFRMGSKWHTIE
jgi:hypothetical protein